MSTPQKEIKIFNTVVKSLTLLESVDAIANSINKKTLVFDEIDTGVSGSVAEAIAIRLLNLSKTQQILIVTHLPQIAARGQQHFKTSKSSKNNIALTGEKELTYKDRRKFSLVIQVKSMVNE